MVEGLDLRAEVRVDAALLLFDLANDGLDGLLAGALVHVVGDVGEHALGHILDALEEGHAEVRDRLFFLEAHGPEPIGQDVILDGAKPLNRAVSTVVVGEHETLAGDELGRAAAPVEGDDGVLQTGLVQGVDVLGGQVQSHLLHLGFVDALEHVEEPHALIGAGVGGEQLECREKQQEETLLHGVVHR